MRSSGCLLESGSTCTLSLRVNRDAGRSSPRCGAPARVRSCIEVAFSNGLRREWLHMNESMRVTLEMAREVGSDLGIDWDVAPFDVEQFRMGMAV